MVHITLLALKTCAKTTRLTFYHNYNERGIYNLAHIAQAVILFLLTTVFLKGAKVALG